MIACIDEREFRSQFVKGLIHDLVCSGISMSRIAVRANIHRASLYRAIQGDVAPNCRSMIQLSEFYTKVFDDHRYRLTDYYSNKSNDIHTNIGLINQLLKTMTTH